MLSSITLRTIHIATFTLVIRSEAITCQTVIVIHTLVGDEAQVLSCSAPKLKLKTRIIELFRVYYLLSF